MAQNIDEEARKVLDSISNKRARIVIKHILEHGQVTTEDILNYGYKHAPRAVRDVREAGIPLDTFHVRDSEGKSIAAYRFGDLSLIRNNRLAGRSTFPKAFRGKLYTVYHKKCTVCNSGYEERYLQVDHRVPYEVGGDDANGVLAIEKFMLLCGSCNRAKSWSCEHCNNWTQLKDPSICLPCYWASPESYIHLAMFPERRMELVWSGDEVACYDWVAAIAKVEGKSIQEVMKHIIESRRQEK